MTKRLKRLWTNTKFGFFQTLIIFIVVLGFTVTPLFYHLQYYPITVAGILGLIMPYFFKEFMVENDVAKKVLRYAGIGIALGSGFFSDQIKAVDIIVCTSALFFLASYISCYFWLSSDERIVFTK